MIYARSNKDPDATLDYSLDWSSWLGNGETISSHSVTVSDGMTLVSSSATETVVSFRVSGGTEGVTYDAVVRITTSLGQIDERTIRIPVAER